MSEHAVDQYIKSEFLTIKAEAETKTARAIVDLLCETGMTIAMAECVLEICKQSLKFTCLTPPTKN